MPNKNNYLDFLNRTAVTEMKSVILRMIRGRRSTIATRVSDSEEGSQLFRISRKAPKFGRLTVEVSKLQRGEDSREFERGSIRLTEPCQDWSEIEVLINVVSPPVHGFQTCLIHALGAFQRDRRQSLAAAQPVQPGAAKHRLIEQTMDIGPPH